MGKLSYKDGENILELTADGITPFGMNYKILSVPLGTVKITWNFDSGTTPKQKVDRSVPRLKPKKETQ